MFGPALGGWCCGKGILSLLSLQNGHHSKIERKHTQLVFGHKMTTFFQDPSNVYRTLLHFLFSGSETGDMAVVFEWVKGDK